jgi:bacterioferritin
MNCNEKLLTALNALLAKEFGFISQYMIQSAQCENWGYGELHRSFCAQATEEVHHTEWLIGRIIELAGSPTVSMVGGINAGKNLIEMINNNQEDKLAVVADYLEAITLAREIEDHESIDLLEKILIVEEEHLEWIERESWRLSDIGPERYVSRQMKVPQFELSFFNQN